MLRSRVPSINHFRVFGCIGYAKTEATHLRKLDDRSRTLVHLGTEPGWKAYWLYDPQSRRAVVSRDVVFDETKVWNWNRINAEEDNVGDLIIEFGSSGNCGIQRTEQNKETKDENGIEEDTVETSVEGHKNNEESSESEDDTDGNENQTQPERVVTRSGRVITKPKYL